jgi:hypothetical protein
MLRFSLYLIFFFFFFFPSSLAEALNPQSAQSRHACLHLPLSTPTLSSPPRQTISPIPYAQVSPPAPPPLPSSSPVLPRRALAYPPSPAPPSTTQPPRNTIQPRRIPSRIVPRNSLGLNRYGYNTIARAAVI